MVAEVSSGNKGIPLSEVFLNSLSGCTGSGIKSYDEEHLPQKVQGWPYLGIAEFNHSGTWKIQ